MKSADQLTALEKEVITKAINRWAFDVENSTMLHALLQFTETEMSALKTIINKIDEWNFAKRTYGAPGYFMVSQREEIREIKKWVEENWNDYLIDMKYDIEKFMTENKIEANV